MDSAIKGFDLALERNQQRLALAIQRLASGHLDTAFADAVLGDIRTLLVIQSYANVVFEHGSDVMRTARVDGQAVGQWGQLSCFVHGYRLFQFSLTLRQSVLQVPAQHR